VKGQLDEITERLPEEFNIQEMLGRTEDRSPYTVVAFQECERMNTLTSEMKRSLKELDLGLKVCLPLEMSC
jgi:dynein heavy chain